MKHNSIISANDLCNLSCDSIKTEPLIDWLDCGNSAMVYAESGLGKTQFCLSLAVSICKGDPFLKWETSKNNCLYVDGEMQLSAMKSRLKSFCGDVIPSNFYLLSHERIELEKSIEKKDDLDIENAAIQDLIFSIAKTNDIKLIILDNLSTLSKSSRNSASKFMNNVAPFILRCRKNKIATIIIHHASKSGKQLGTCASKFILDIVIKLSRTKNNTEIELSFEKSRHLTSEQSENILYTLDSGGEKNKLLVVSEQRSENIFIKPDALRQSKFVSIVIQIIKYSVAAILFILAICYASRSNR